MDLEQKPRDGSFSESKRKELTLWICAITCQGD